MYYDLKRAENGLGRPLNDDHSPNAGEEQVNGLAPASEDQLRLRTQVLKAQNALASGKPEKTIAGYRKDVLEELCRLYTLDIPEKATKMVIAQLLIAHAKVCIHYCIL